MKNHTILALIGLEASAAELAPFLEKARDTGAHVAVIVVGVAPRLPAPAYGVTPYAPALLSDDWHHNYTDARKKLIAKAEDIESILATHDVSGDVATIFGDALMIEQSVADRARFCDFVYLSQDLRANGFAFDHALRGALFDAPAGVVLNGLSAKAADHVLIAWNASLGASRAVHAARAILTEAKQVTVAVFDPIMTESHDGENSGSDLAKWLSHMGCNVTVQQYPSGGKEIGTCIKERAEELGADMVVMGAYDHSRLRQAMFGGTTRTMVEQTEIPVLLAH